jgi:hypothetical protein
MGSIEMARSLWTELLAPAGWDWGSAPDWVAAFAICATLVVAWIELRKVGLANAGQEAVARADLMLKIDQIFEGGEMAASRLAVRTLRNQCEFLAKEERPGANNKEVLIRSAVLFSEQLTKLYQDYKTTDARPKSAAEDLTKVAADESGVRYAELMRLPYWMETVGMLTVKELLRESDVLGLYDAVYVGVLPCFRQHIMDRRDEQPYGNQRFLEYALDMLKRAEAAEMNPIAPRSG